ncbi:MAG TPA: hypothetical protein VGM39_17455 [Kofleriaceae bacterium]
MRWMASLVLLAASGCPAPTAAICDNGDICPATSSCIPNAGCRIESDGGGGDDGGGGSDASFDTWTSVSAGTSPLLGVWASPEGTAYMLASNGDVLVFDGTTVSPLAMPVPTVANHALIGIWGRTADEIYVAHDDRIHRWNGTAWVSALTNDENIKQQAGSATLMMAVGNTFISYGDTAWHAPMMVTNPAASFVLRAVAVDQNTWVAVGSNVVLDGTGATQENGSTTGADYSGVAFAGSEVVVIGPQKNSKPGLFRLENHTSFIQEDAEVLTGYVDKPLYAVWGDASGALAVGDDAHIFRRSGQTWTQETTPTDCLTLAGVTVTATDELAVGSGRNGGCFLRRTKH